MQSSSLSELKEELSVTPAINILSDYLEGIDTANLVESLTTTNGMFKKSATKMAAEKLALHAVRGEYDQVCAIIKKSPQLLLENPGKITDYSGRTIDSESVYRVILGTEDVEIIAAAKQALVTHAGKAVADEQYNAQFLAGWFEVEEKEWSELSDQLKKLDEAIHAATDYDIKFDEKHQLTFLSEKVATELAKFHALLEETKKRPIKTGRHFNSNFFQAVCKHYDRLCNNFDWTGAKCKLFWQRMIGYIQRFLPACDAQAFVAGLYITANNLKTGNKQNRDFSLEVWSHAEAKLVSSHFYPLVDSLLGVDYAACGGRRWRARAPGARLALGGGVWLENLYKSKTSCLQKLIPNQAAQTVSMRFDVG